MPSDPDAPADKRMRAHALALAATVALAVGVVLVLVSTPCSSAGPAALFSARRAWHAVPQRLRADATAPRFTLRAQMTLRGLKPRAREEGVTEAFHGDEFPEEALTTNLANEHYERFPADSAEQWRQDELMHKESDDWLSYWGKHLDDEFPEELPQGDDELMHKLSLGAPSALNSLHSLSPLTARPQTRVCMRATTIDPPPRSLMQGRTVTAGSTRRRSSSRRRGRPSSSPPAQMVTAWISPAASSASSSAKPTRMAPARSTRTR
jgi:hypothetical protein